MQKRKSFKRINSLDGLPKFNLQDFLLTEDQPAKWWLNILGYYSSVINKAKRANQLAGLTDYEKFQYIINNRDESWPPPSAYRLLNPENQSYLQTQVLVEPIGLTDAIFIRNEYEERVLEKRDISLPIHAGENKFTNTGYFTVDLSASNDALVRDFLKAVEEARLIKGVDHPAKSITLNKLSKLREYRILPLLELILWEEITKSRIKKSVLSLALFPDGTKGERELTETIIPFAKSSITTEFLKELSSLC